MPIDLYRNPLSDTIFVFGSNLAGRHGAGAAKFAAQFYGAGYADMQNRTPSIEKITNLLGWLPKVSLREAVRLTLAAMVPND